ncbi:MAG: B12-binding domain-containing radical SAM protein [Deltaproteobacteria bacterium]|nr:B12-binding domain-containing radical SAM protein [Deltaproteobacteria bacterium]
MLVRLVTPANEDSAYVKSLGVAILAAHTPADVDLAYTDDLLDPIDLRRLPPADLVGLSVCSKTARRAYALADAWRAAGARVVLGGIHATALPDEARAHADAVVVGEAEGLWERVVDDARRGRLQALYRHDGFPSLVGLPWPRRDRALYRSRRYVPFDVVQTMRGCPFPCEFCSVNVQAGTQLRLRPTREVLAEVERLGRLLLLADDNVLVDPRRARDLLAGLAPLGKSWIGQASLAGLDDAAHVGLLRRSGCQALFVGFETLSAASLRGAGKRQNDPARYRDVAARLADAGIAVWGSFVFGFDQDDPAVFDRTVAFAREAGLTMALFALLTPYPGTPLYARLRRAGRLTSPRWWLEEDHDRRSPYFAPLGMTRAELRAGWQRAWRDFYSLGSILQRWRPRVGAGWLETLGYLPLNAFMRRLTRRKILAGERFFRRE